MDSVVILTRVKRLLEKKKIKKAAVLLSGLGLENNIRLWRDLGNAYCRMATITGKREYELLAMRAYLLGLRSNYFGELEIRADRLADELIRKLTRNWNRIDDARILRPQLLGKFGLPSGLSRSLQSFTRDHTNGLAEIGNSPDILLQIVKTLLKKENGAEKVAEVLDAFRRYEPILHALNPLYRDHIVHPVRVYFLGLFLVNEMKNCNAQRLKSWLEKIPRENSMTLSRFSAAWFLAAVFHDMAYPLEKLNNVNRALQSYFGATQGFDLQVADFRARLGWSYKSSYMLGLISTVGQQFEPRLYHLLTGAIDNTDHGILASLILANSLLDEISESIPYSEPPESYLQSIAQAIALHNIQLPVDFERLPMVFLLKLCDELQEWDRLLTFEPAFRGAQNIFVRVADTPDQNSYEFHALIDFRKIQKVLEKYKWEAGRAVADKARLRELTGQGIYGSVYCVSHRKRDSVRLVRISRTAIGATVELPCPEPIVESFW